jgi:hypothetical protein
MKIRFLRIFIVLIVCAILFAGCKSAGTVMQTLTTSPAISSTSAANTSATTGNPFTPGVLDIPDPLTPVTSPQPGAAVGSPFIPGEVMAALPVFPDASPTTYLDPGFGPPSFPSGQMIYGITAPGYQSASAQYTATASVTDILNWYLAELGALGYTQQGEDDAGNGTVAERSVVFVLPSQPAISVQVHVYTVSGSSRGPVFELLVIYTVPLPKPSAENLPGDIQNVKIDYYPGATNEVIKTFTDAKTLNSLANEVNALPVAPDVFRSMPIGISPQTLFTLTFHSKSQGDIMITDVTYDGIHFGDYPLLSDPNNFFQVAVAKIAGIQTN